MSADGPAIPVAPYCVINLALPAADTIPSCDKGRVTRQEFDVERQTARLAMQRALKNPRIEPE